MLPGDIEYSGDAADFDALNQNPEDPTIITPEIDTIIGQAAEDLPANIAKYGVNIGVAATVVSAGADLLELGADFLFGADADADADSTGE